MFSNACAYKFGLSNRALPGGYAQIAIPIFRNETQEVGIETLFTNSLVRRFARSQVATVIDQDNSPLVLEGSVHQLKIINGSGVTNSPNQLPLLPTGTVLTTEYRMAVTTKIKLRRRSDDKIVWEGSFTNERVYQAPRIGTPVVNSANATYNQSVRMRTIALVADDMMSEAHDRMTENF
jgi:hypothetical protein